MVRVFREGEEPEELEAGELDQDGISAIDSEIRIKILKRIADEPTFPAEISRELELEKQKTYYHFKKLEKADLIKKIGEKTYSGGTANVYGVSNNALAIDLGAAGRKTFLPSKNSSTEKLLNPLIENGKIKGKIVVGSSEKHGKDQVRAQDGHLSGEIAAKLGNYGKVSGKLVILDTELRRTGNYNQNLLILGGILTNTVAKKYNGEFPVKFSGERFPYREIETPDNVYSDPRIGFIARTGHPENEGQYIYIVAGVRREGTRAAVEAFRDLETITKEYNSGEFYAVVEGMDQNGDGTIDSFELVESGF